VVSKVGGWLFCAVLLAGGCSRSSRHDGNSGGAGATGGFAGATGSGGATRGGSGGSGGSAGKSSGSAGKSSGSAGKSGATGGAGGSSGSGEAGDAGDGGGSSGAAGALVPYFHAGSRLKPMVVSAGAGLDIIDSWPETGWFDSELDMQCFFLPDENGVERCFPFSYLGSIAGLVHADSSCTRPVVTLRGSGPCDRLRYEHMVVDDSCGYRGFRVGNELPVSTPLFTRVGGACEPSSLELPSDGHVYELDAVPAETFVGMQRRHEPRAGRLDAHVREGEDGSWQVIGFFDTARGAPCQDLSPDLVSEAKCYPPSAGWAGLFGDASCQTRVADVMPVSQCSLETPTVIRVSRIDPDSCPTTYEFELYEIDGTEERDRYADDGAGMCTAASRPGPVGNANVYVQGSAVDVATLPTTEQLVVGGGAVQGRFLGFGGVPFFPALRGSGPFIDGQSGEPCRALDFVDGALRCVPNSFMQIVPVNLYYEGADCDGSRLLPWSAPCPGTPEPSGVTILGSDECGVWRILETHALAGKTSAAVVSYVSSATSMCESLDPTTVTTSFFRFGEPLNPASTFPAVERVVRD
jgi:hypothetical protein